MTTATCTHHWLLATGEPVTSGTCKRCGATREFKPDMKEYGHFTVTDGPSREYTSAYGLYSRGGQN